jgi:steroid 5-alpha reductase family enzyme
MESGAGTRFVTIGRAADANLRAVVRKDLDKHIRKIFSVFALVMIAMFVTGLTMGIWSNLNWIMLGVGALCCLLVFWNFVFVFNFSYALACVINGSVLAAWYANGPAILLGGLMTIYGLRLFFFTLLRVRSTSYAQRAANVRKADEQMPTPIKFAIWLQCSFLYCFHLFAIYLAGMPGVITTSVLAGAAVILAGILIEGFADFQKQRVKAVDRDAFVATGLYARWRHPNYGGEILVQVGLLIVGFGVASGWLNYVVVAVSPLYILLLMIAECGRSDKYMELRFGDQSAFREYAARSGCYLPKVGIAL